MTVNSLTELDALIAAARPAPVLPQSKTPEPAPEPRNRHERRKAAALARRQSRGVKHW